MYHLKLKKNFSILFFIFTIVIVPSQIFSKIPTTLTSEYGGDGGVPFVEMVAPNSTIYGIIIKSGKFIDSISNMSLKQ